jgi:lipoprotein-releasing system permease protein
VRYELFLAKRYALSRRSQNFITVISIISSVGIAVGVAALISVLSVFNGFSTVVTDILIKFDPHIRIAAVRNDSTDIARIENVGQLLPKIREVSHAERAAATIRSKAVIVHYTLPRVAIINGIDEKNSITDIAKHVEAGKMQLDDDGIILGQSLADNLAIAIGDTIQLFSPIGIDRILTEPVQPKNFPLIVRGIFVANNREYDALYAYVNMNVARSLLELPPNTATHIEVKLPHISSSTDAKEALTAVLHKEQYEVQTWYDLHRDLYEVMQLERWIAYFILILIVAVASFSIFSALTMTVYEKQRDIGLLLALGAEQSHIRRIYYYQGFITGAIGIVVGCLLGLGVVLAQQQFHFFALDTSVYIIPALPVELRWTDFIFVSLGATILVTLTSLVPSRKAARVEPAEALRWE